MPQEEQLQPPAKQDNPWLSGLQTLGGRVSLLAGIIGAIGLLLEKSLGVLKQLTSVGPWVDAVVVAIVIFALYRYYKIVQRLKRIPSRQITAFIGSAAFTEEDKERFFGRQGEIDDLCRRISAPDTVVCTIFGQSGCGKTSIARAGVIPEIERRYSYKGIYVRLYNRPEQALRTVLDQIIHDCYTDVNSAPNSDEAPANNSSLTLEDRAALAKKLTGKRLIFFIDQFEEFFLSDIAESERAKFTNFISALLDDDSRIRPKFVFLIRGDFLYRMTALETMTGEDVLSKANRFPLAVFDRTRADIVIRESLRSAAGAAQELPWADDLIDAILDDLALQKNEIDIGETRILILPAELQIVCQVVQQRGWTRPDQYTNKIKLIRDYVREAVDSSPDPTLTQAILIALIHDNGITRAEPQTTQQLSSRLEKADANGISEQLEYLDRQRRLVNQVIQRSPENLEVAYELSHEYLVTVLRPLYSEYLDKTEKANTLLRQSRKNVIYHPAYRLTFTECRLIRKFSPEPLTVGDRDLLRRSELRIGLQLAAAITFPTLIVLGLHFGILRLSRLPSSGGETLVVRRGVNLFKPVLGSEEVHLEVSDRLFELSAGGQTVFIENGFLHFPSMGRSLYSWLNQYYLDRVTESKNAQAATSEFFFRQLDVNDRRGEDALIAALSTNAVVAHDVVRAHLLTADKYKAVLLRNLGGTNDQGISESLNTLQELYGDSDDVESHTKAALASCNSQVALGLFYLPDSNNLEGCIGQVMNSKRWNDAADLAVWFHSVSTPLEARFVQGLSSSDPDEFLAAASIVSGFSLKNEQIVSSLKRRLDAKENERIRKGAALALWSIDVDEELVRQQIRAMFAKALFAPPSYYLALYRSTLSDPEVTRYLENGLHGYSVGSWVVEPPRATEIVNKLSADQKDLVVKNLQQQLQKETEDLQRALGNARLVEIGCRDLAVITNLDHYVSSGVSGLGAFIVMPEISEAYGELLLGDGSGSFHEALGKLWGLLQSKRSEASSDYRLAVEFAIAKLVSSGTSDSDIQSRRIEAIRSIHPWADDYAPHHRAAYVNTCKLIRQTVNRKKFLSRIPQFGNIPPDPPTPAVHQPHPSG